MMFDYGELFSQLLSPIFGVIGTILKGCGCILGVFLFLFLLGFFLLYLFSPKVKQEESAAVVPEEAYADSEEAPVAPAESVQGIPTRLRFMIIRFKWYDLFRWLLVDLMERKLHVSDFGEYGFTFFVGRQGAGKTTSMVYYLDQMKKRYPDCKIVTNFGYDKADVIMTSWRDLMEIRNDTSGVVFAIDEIHSEYSSASWKDVPESLLSEISQQRKQRVKIVATAQYFSRVAKPLREQAFSVVACRCFLKRLVICREYDSLDYITLTENPSEIKKKIRPLRKYSYVSTDTLRSSFDTYEKIERMRKTDFIPRDQRGE